MPREPPQLPAKPGFGVIGALGRMCAGSRGTRPSTPAQDVFMQRLHFMQLAVRALAHLVHIPARPKQTRTSRIV